MYMTDSWSGSKSVSPCEEIYAEARVFSATTVGKFSLACLGSCYDVISVKRTEPLVALLFKFSQGGPGSRTPSNTRRISTCNLSEDNPLAIWCTWFEISPTEK